MAAEYENLSSTAVAVTETRVDRTTVDPAVDGIPNVSDEAKAGLHGLYLLGAGSLQNGPFCKIRVITAATFSAFVGHNLSGSWTGVAFPAGFEIEGYFTTIALSGGSVVLYKV